MKRPKATPTIKHHRHILALMALMGLCLPCAARQIHGRVVDEQGQPVSFASAYLKENPVEGTATDQNGCFTLEASKGGTVVVSFIGYEVREISESRFGKADTLLLRLQEQPIRLDETVVEARASRRNRKKAMKELLRQVEMRMNADFPDEAVKYRVVSDVKANSDQSTMGMEEMIGYVVELPNRGRKGMDSIQFYGQLSKRYFNPGVEGKMRPLADAYAGRHQLSDLEMQIDSGSMAHQILWGGSVCQVFRKWAGEPKRWSVSRENEEESVLTYVETHNYLGLVRISLQAHYVIDSYNYSLHRVSHHLDAQATIPFGRKLKGEYLGWLNILNMSEQDIEKFRLKKIKARASRNTIYQTTDNRTTVKEKNSSVRVNLTDNKDHTLTLHSTAKARVTDTQTRDVKPYSRQQLRRKVPRKNIEL